MFRLLLTILTLMSLSPNVFIPIAMAGEVVTTRELKNVGLATAFSTVLPGAGQFYNGEGEIGKGYFFAVLSITFWSLRSAGVEDNDDGYDRDDDDHLAVFGQLGLIGTATWSAIDANRSAKRINAELRQARLRVTPMFARNKGIGARLTYTF